MKNLINLPNALTTSRIILTPIFFSLVLSESWHFKGLALVVFGIASLTDLCDGYLARKRGNSSRFGRFLDPLADKILVSSALISFVLLKIVAVWLVAAILIRDFVITALRMYAIYRGRQIAPSRLAKWKTTIQLVAIFLILGFMSARATLDEFKFKMWFIPDSWSYDLIEGLMVIVTLVTVVSGVRYLTNSGRQKA